MAYGRKPEAFKQHQPPTNNPRHFSFQVSFISYFFLHSFGCLFDWLFFLVLYENFQIFIFSNFVVFSFFSFRVHTNYVYRVINGFSGEHIALAYSGCFFHSLEALENHGCFLDKTYNIGNKALGQVPKWNRKLSSVCVH